MQHSLRRFATANTIDIRPHTVRFRGARVALPRQTALNPKARSAGHGLNSSLGSNRRTDAPMTEPYTRASELKDFAFCQRAWFLERQGMDTELTDAREIGTADHLHRATAVRRGRTLDGLGRFLFILGLIGLAVMILVSALRR
jgi:hypothetical protein